jgi:type II restriction enzyme
LQAVIGCRGPTASARRWSHGFILEQGLAAVYNSGLQRARVLTEPWVADQVYCPNCGSFPLIRYLNDSQIGDFHCSVCNDNFELKSKRTQFGPRVDDGAYPAMLRRLDGKANPNILLLNYDLTSLTVTNLAIIPKHFVTIDMIEKKRPLGPAARRKGWVGCRILIQAIPQSGRIAIIRAGIVEPKTAVLEKWRHTLFLRKQMDLDAKGWLVHVMKCIERLGKSHFTLDEVYSFEDELQAAYQDNRNIRAKIRQRLQVLRDNGYIDFMGGGTYKRTGATV